MPYTVACCYGLLGDKAAALAMLQKAMDLGYRDLNQVRTDPDLTLLHGTKQFEELAATKATTKMSRVEGYRYDLWFLARELRRMHFNPYRRVSRVEFDQFVRETDKAIASLSDEAIGVRFKQLAVMAGDGHTHVTLNHETNAAKKGLPLGFYDFEGQYYVNRAAPGQDELLGARLLAIDGVPVELARDKAKSIVASDNPMNFVSRVPFVFRMPGLLYGLGIAKSSDWATLTMVLAGGTAKDVTLQAISSETPDWVLLRTKSKNPTPLTFLHRDKNYWLQPIPESKAVYFQYNSVANDRTEPISAIAGRLSKAMDDPAVDRLILDVRWNGGGNNFLNAPLLEAIVKSEKINRRGHFFVITGRNTFSAAMCFVAQLDRYTHPIFAGEPTGSSPNFIGESIPITLPYSKWTGTVSDLYWQNGTAMDNRIWIAPEIYVPPTFKDYKENLDPVVEACLKWNG